MNTSPIAYLEALENHDNYEREVYRELIALLTDEVTGEIRENLITEIKCAGFSFRNGILHPQKEVIDSRNNRYFITDTSLFEPKEWEYLKNRAKTATKLYLKGRYSHLIWLNTKNANYGNSTVDIYLELAKYYQEKEANEDFLAFDNLLDCLRHITFNLKYKTDDYKAYLIQLLYDKELSLISKHSVLKNIIESPLFSKEDFNGMAAYVVEEVKKSETIYFFTKDVLNTCLKLAQKEKVGNHEIYELLGHNELFLAQKRLADDKTGMVPLASYQSAAVYFKHAKNETKHQEAKNLYAAQKEKVVLQKVSIEISDEPTQWHFNGIKNLVDWLLDQEPVFPYAFLVYNKEFLKTEEELPSDDNRISSMFRVSIFDKNNNSKTLQSGKDRETYNKFRALTFQLQTFILPVMEGLFRKGNQKERMGCAEVLSFFNSTWFSQCLEISNGEDKLSFSWMELLGNGIEQLTSNLELEAIQDGYIPNFQLFIDSTATKIEAIIRDIARLSNIPVSKNKESESTEMLLEELLRDEKVIDLFDAADICLIKYLLTNCGWNLRNDVAHGFCRPQNYTKTKALLLLLVLFRLSKYNYCR